MAKAGQSNRVTWVWGNREKGIAVVRSARKSKGKYWYDIWHVMRGEETLVHRDYPTKAEAIREAKSYARHEKKHPRSSFFDF